MRIAYIICMLYAHIYVSISECRWIKKKRKSITTTQIRFDLVTRHSSSLSKNDARHRC